MIKGKLITITNHGVPIAVLQPPESKQRIEPIQVIAEWREFRRKHCLDGLSFPDMIEEGRRCMSENFVVDNSVVMTWCFSDETNKYSDAILDSLNTSTAFVPSIWPLEVGNVLLNE